MPVYVKLQFQESKIYYFFKSEMNLQFSTKNQHVSVSSSAIFYTTLANLE